MGLKLCILHGLADHVKGNRRAKADSVKGQNDQEMNSSGLNVNSKN